jgi:hypothetical protein
MISYFSTIEIIRVKAFDIESELVEDIGELPEQSLFVKKINRHIETCLLDWHIAPTSRDSPSEMDTSDIRTISTVYRHDSFSDSSEEFISGFWDATLSKFIRDISLSPDDNIFYFI